MNPLFDNYSDYQVYLFNRISKLFGENVTFERISDILNQENLKTPYGHRFSNRHTWSIYKKGLNRLTRINQPDKVILKCLGFRMF